MDVAVGSGEVVGLGALFGDFDAVADEVVAASIQTGKQAVPVALDVLGLDAQLLGNGAGDFDVVAHEGVALIVEAPGLPCAFQRDDQLAVGLDGLQLVGGSSRSRSCGRGGSSSRIAGATTCGQSQSSGGNTGCCQKAATRNLLHDKILLRFSSFRAVRSARVAHRPFIYCTHFSKNFKSEQGLMKNVLFFKKM